MSEPALYRQEKPIPGKVYRHGNDMVPVEPDYEAAWKAWKATGNIEDAVDAALGIGDTDE